MSIEIWENYFKPESRSAGQALVKKGVVNLARGSDTEVQCYIRGSSPVKVNLSTESIDSTTVFAKCNCAQGKKGQLCKHIWATLNVIVEKNPDFLEAKTEITSAEDSASTTSTAKPQSEATIAYAAKRAEYATAQKEKQSAFRKEQYQKQKQKADLKKGKAPKAAFVEQHPEEVEAALHYFDTNGFELRGSLDANSISLARKQLARVFHPDKGGNHDEILELNNHADVLLQYCRNT